jgi:probable F420-dependent oxidoreductase
VAAAATEQLRLAITVLDNDFRHPVMVAKEIATLDVLSEGRVDMGLGAGWLEEDYTKTGVTTWDSPSTRVNRLFESIDLLRKLFTGEPVSFEGDYYRVTDFASYPQPLQRPLPLMIGARGRRMLSFAARQAQIVSVLAAPTEGGSRLAGFRQQLAWIEKAGGADRTDLVLGVRMPLGELAANGESWRAPAERVAQRTGMSVDDVIESPFAVVGDLPSIKDKLLSIHERFGVSYFTISEELAWQIGPIVTELKA